MDTPKKAPSFLNLLRPAKMPVQTSIGVLYIRHIYISDWKSLDTDDLEVLGRLIISQLVNRKEDKSDSTALSNKDMGDLTDNDFSTLIEAIAKKCGWEIDQHDLTLPTLGKLAKLEREREQAQQKNLYDKIQNSINTGYGFLPQKTLDKLKEQISGITDVRESLRAGLIPDGLKSSMLGVSAYEEAIRNAKLSDLTAAKEMLAPNAYYEKMRADRNEPIELPKLWIPPNPEDTTIGRSAIETSQHTKETAQLMAVLADTFTGLNNTVVTEVLPAWFKQVEDNQKQAEEAFRQAGRSLQWTKWAVIASIVVTLGATWWQVSVAREIDESNAIQQKKAEADLRMRQAAIEALLKQQIEVQEKILQQYVKIRSAQTK